MRFCKNCSVSLRNELEFCPLCGMKTVEGSDPAVDEDYPFVNPRLTKGFFIKSVTFSVIVAVILSFLIDHLLEFTGIWYLLVTTGLVYGWLTFITVMKNLRDPGGIVFSQVILASICCAVIDRLCGWLKWSVNYVIPGLVAAAAIAIVLCISIRPEKFRTYTIYQFFIALFGAVPLAVWHWGPAEIEWTAAASAAVAFFCFALILVFSHRHTRSELKKRFHV